MISKVSYQQYNLNFSFAAGTSRGTLQRKTSWFIFLENDKGETGTGECSLLKGLSMDDRPDFEEKLKEVSGQINQGKPPDLKDLYAWPSLRFGIEMARKDLAEGGRRLLFPSDFTLGKKPIPINGLVWMGDFGFMKKQVREKIDVGFNCIKLKIGAIDFDKEMELIRLIRREFSADDIEIRVDANGAFHQDEALEKLKRLSAYGLHSIEQPIRQGHWEAMAELCEKTPLAIALDEELIGINEVNQKLQLLQNIKPQYIILKPSLLGGFAASEEWINQAEELGSGWWITSALESNIGLNAIAQWTYTLNNSMPQGLGTGQLYTNNFESPLTIERGRLFYRPENEWNLSNLNT